MSQERANDRVRGATLPDNGSRYGRTGARVPLFADAAYDNVERAIFWPDRPFSGEIMDQLDDREVLLLANVRLYTKLMGRPDGTFHFTDDDGHAWGIPAHAVVAVDIHDPELKRRDRRPRIGFQFAADEAPDGLPTNVVPLRRKP